MAIHRMVSFEELADVLDSRRTVFRALIKETAKDIGEGIERRTRSKLGEYQDGWPQLAESTQAKRVAQGDTPNDPLLQRGDYRESFHTTVKMTSRGADAYVGSDAPQARAQELGYGAIPARPHLEPAALEAASDIGRKVETLLEQLFEED